jgi:hypothetical protein
VTGDPLIFSTILTIRACGSMGHWATFVFTYLVVVHAFSFYLVCFFIIKYTWL